MIFYRSPGAAVDTGAPAGDRVCAAELGGILYALSDGVLYAGSRELLRLDGPQEDERELIPYCGDLLILPDGLRVSPDGSVAACAATNVCTNVTVTMSAADGRPLTAASSPSAPGEAKIYYVNGRAVVKAVDDRGELLETGPVTVTLSAPGIGASLRRGDSIGLSGAGSLSGRYVLTGASSGAVSFEGFTDLTTLASARVYRSLPRLRRGVVHDGRIWAGSADGGAVCACPPGDCLDMSGGGDGIKIDVRGGGPFVASFVSAGRLYFAKADGIYEIIKKTASKDASTVTSWTYRLTPTPGIRDSAVTGVGDEIYFLSESGVAVTKNGRTRVLLDAEKEKKLSRLSAGLRRELFSEEAASQTEIALAGEGKCLLVSRYGTVCVDADTKEISFGAAWDAAGVCRFHGCEWLMTARDGKLLLICPDPHVCGDTVQTSEARTTADFEPLDPTTRQRRIACDPPPGVVREIFLLPADGGAPVSIGSSADRATLYGGMMKAVGIVRVDTTSVLSSEF